MTILIRRICGEERNVESVFAPADKVLKDQLLAKKFWSEYHSFGTTPPRPEIDLRSDACNWSLVTHFPDEQSSLEMLVFAINAKARERGSNISIELCDSVKDVFHLIKWHKSKPCVLSIEKIEE